MSRKDAEVQRVQDEKQERKEKKSWVTLENMGGIPQPVYTEEGVRHTLNPHEIRPFPEDVANLFLQGETARYVQIYKPVEIPERPGMPTIWMANMTGNPFTPPEIEVERIEHGEKIKHRVPNPIREATTLRYEVRQDQEIRQGDDGQPDVINHAPQHVKLPPYRRLAVPACFMLQLTNRDAYQPTAHQGKIIRCRPPREDGYEPNDSWKYEDVRVFAELTDDRYFTTKRFPPAKTFKDEDELSKAKNKLLNELFFRLVDDRYPLPTKAAVQRRKEAVVT